MQLLTAGRRHASALVFAPDGRALVAACRRHAPVLWKLPATDEPVPLTDAVSYDATNFTFSADASVVSWIDTHQRREYDRPSGTTREVTHLPDGESAYAQTSCGPGGRLIVATAEREVGGRIRALRSDAGGQWAEVWTVGPNDVGVVRLAGCPRADRFFTWETQREENHWTYQLVMRSSLTGEVIDRMDAPVTFIDDVAAKPDGTALIMFKDSSLYFWCPGEKVRKVRTGTLKHYRSVAFHPEGRYLLAGNNDTTARLIDTDTWEVARQFTWDIGRLTAVAVSPDGALAAAGGDRGRVVVWDLDV
jgi:WD40 repeat protein